MLSSAPRGGSTELGARGYKAEDPDIQLGASWGPEGASFVPGLLRLDEKTRHVT